MPANADNAKEVTKVDQDQINQFARYNQQERVEKMVIGLFDCENAILRKYCPISMKIRTDSLFSEAIFRRFYL